MMRQKIRNKRFGVRDIGERLGEFLNSGGVPGNFSVEQIALTREQVKEYNPPPNPAKITDPRAKWYIREKGNKSWEVDALPPEVMIDLVEQAIGNHLDFSIWEDIIHQEEIQKEKLREVLKLF